MYFKPQYRKSQKCPKIDAARAACLDASRHGLVIYGSISEVLSAALLIVLVAGCAGPRRISTAEYDQRYDRPLSSSGSQFATLPPAVQNTIRAETGSADIREVAKDNSSGHLFYRIYFQNSELFPPLYIAPDGRLVDPQRLVAVGAPLDKTSIVTGGPVAGISLNDLPAAVIKAIQTRVPDAEINTILKEGRGDQTTYLVSFKDGLHPPLRLAPDGSAL